VGEPADDIPAIAVEHREGAGPLCCEVSDHLVQRLFGGEWSWELAHCLGDCDLAHRARGLGSVDVDPAAAQLQRVDRLAREMVAKRGREECVDV
jgi:hypothetical protein